MTVNSPRFSYSLAISAEEFSALRAIILAKYPQAAAPPDNADPTTDIVLHDLAKQEMVVATGRKKVICWLLYNI